MGNTPETSGNNTAHTTYISEGAMTPVHIPKLDPDEKRRLPKETVEACEILVTDMLTNQTAG